MNHQSENKAKNTTTIDNPAAAKAEQSKSRTGSKLSDEELAKAAGGAIDSYMHFRDRA